MLGWSINLFRVFGIQLSVHASFVLLLAYFAYEGSRDGGAIGAFWSVCLIVLFFVCVVLHELGHALTARRYGVRTPRILLMPIGGMAQMDRIPRQPSAELLVTVAGPAVNFVMAALFAPLFLGKFIHWDAVHPYGIDNLGINLMVANVLMGAFNLLPVFPMDGGRILRALLARRMPYLRATEIAVKVGKVLAIVFAAVALLYLNRPLLFALFLFIFFAGDAEYRILLRREEESRYWAEMARRVSPQRQGEPPVIL